MYEKGFMKTIGIVALIIKAECQPKTRSERQSRRNQEPEPTGRASPSADRGGKPGEWGMVLLITHQLPRLRQEPAQIHLC